MIVEIKPQQIMPQGDFVNFSSTTFWVGLTFLGGYFVFVGWWVPRILLTLKSRWWLQQFSVHAVGASTVTPLKGVSVEKFLGSAGVGLTSTEFLPELSSAVWPESFLFFVEFTALITLLSTLSFPAVLEKLPTPTTVTTTVQSEHTVTEQVVNLVGLWAAKRSFRYGHFFYKVNEVTTRVVTSLTQGLPSVLPGLSTRLKRVVLHTGND